MKEVLFDGEAFDRELTLAELLTGLALPRLSASLAVMLEVGFRLTDAKGRPVLEAGTVDEGAAVVDVRLEIEPIGWLSARVPMVKLQAAATWLELLLRSQVRYHMAARLHEEQVNHDYQVLQQKHAALLESEQQFRKLSEELEARVQEQVATIKTAERQLYQAEKLASVGKLAAGVAHEINNPIGFIRSNLGSASDYVRRLMQLGEEVESGNGSRIASAWNKADMDFVLKDFHDLLQESIAGADRVARIVADLKEFSNVDRAQEETIQLNESVRAACNIAHSQMAGHAEIALELGELPPLTCHQGHINQLLLNLLVNALQAVEGRPGRIRIATELVGPEIKITISDNGCGISPEHLPRIFDPFFTTRDVGRGMGLGLPVSRDIAQAHGGRIEVESEVEKGSIFTVFLPAS